MRALIFFLLLLCVGCEQKTNHSNLKNNITKEQKTSLHIAVSGDCPPFVFEKNETLTGFDIELITLLAKKLGKKIHLHDIDFQDILKTVVAGKVDAAIATITKTPERAKIVDFSIPYHSSITVLVTPFTTAIRRLEDLAGKTVGVEKGTIYEDFIKSQKTALPDVNILSGAKFSQLLEALNKNECHAIITGYSEAHELQSINPNFKILPIENTAVRYAIAVPKHSPLLNDINNALQDLVTSGELRKLENKFFRQLIKE